MPDENANVYYTAKAKWSSRWLDEHGGWGWELLSDEWMRRDAGPTLVDAIQKKAPVGKHFDLQGVEHPTYELRNSIYPAYYHLGRDAVRIEIRSRKKQARFVTEGTHAHPIVRHGASTDVGGGAVRPTLAFWWEKKGRAAFPWMVNHPGTKPNPFAKKAGLEVSPFLLMELERRIKERLRK